MSTAFVTTSYAPDLDRFARLHDSVLRHSDLLHYVFVPQADLPRFSPLQRSGRLRLMSTRDVLPRGIVTTEWLNRAAARHEHAPGVLRVAAVNLARPWPPLRGWILQQLVKLAAADHVDADTLVFVDSESRLIRPVTHETFRRDGCSRFYRRPGGIHAGMTRHCAWHRTARRLLGVEGDDPLPYDDYIGGITSWDAALARACTARVAELSGRPWPTVLGGCLDLSEYIVYGEYVMACAPPALRAFESDRSLCHVYWQREPLDRERAVHFVESTPADAVAIHVQSNVSVAPEVERYVIDAVSE